MAARRGLAGAPDGLGWGIPEKVGPPILAAAADSCRQRGIAAMAPRFRYAKWIRFACSVSSARKAGWAMPISSRARCLADLPRSCATPYSVTT
jgi:hypothetical protein